MVMTRKVRQCFSASPIVEGAGVHLKRAFGFQQVPLFDPFLMLDDFRADSPDQYLRGFPWHPHRGIETITYMLTGDMEHGDSLGNKGVISAGDVQWMTAGSGIVHQEMPKGDKQGRMGGFQLWANLPATSKMMAPRYRDVTSDQIPAVTTSGGATVRIIAGEVAGTRGPVADIVTEPEYLDVSLPAASRFSHPTTAGHTVFSYVIEGLAIFGGEVAGNTNVVLFEDGDEVLVESADEPVRFLLFAGRPIGEPIVWRGPIVMNSQEELEQAFAEYRNGTFAAPFTKSSKEHPFLF